MGQAGRAAGAVRLAGAGYRVKAGGNGRSGRLWAITSYYNPVGYRRRRSNYSVFRERLKAPLLAAELAYGSGFELGDGDAEILLRLRGSSVLWQKERLLNLALAALPPECTKVAWIDCDVFFDDPDWDLALERALDEAVLVHPFSRVNYLPREWTPADGSCAGDFTRRSIAAVIDAGTPPAKAFEHTNERRLNHSTGFVWGARRDLLERHRFYDASIIGGGDRLLVCAAYGFLEGAARVHRDQPARRDHFSRWGEAFAADVVDAIGVLDLTLNNLWHGDMINRRPGLRYEGLDEFAFDPARDIAIDAAGAWRWASDKPGLHRYVRDYFIGRREDG
jgi:hypothetical protein